jgi:hypothetical protein
VPNRKATFGYRISPLLLAEGDNQVAGPESPARLGLVGVAYSPTAIDSSDQSKRLTNTEIIDIPYTTTHELRNVMRLMPGRCRIRLAVSM